MNTVVCTLFEGSYHYGVAALTNSLYKNGYRGDVYAGYKGKLPIWANSALDNLEIGDENIKTLNLTNSLTIHFVLLQTSNHLTNYKPDYMLELLGGPAMGVDAIFYADPDIVLNAPWTFIEEWVTCGVALCEDINSPLPSLHPRRVAWRRKLKDYNINLKFKEQQYVNGGFVGVSSVDISFLEQWKDIQGKMANFIGGLDKSSLKGQALATENSGPFAPFSKTDQDALNCTVEATSLVCSIIGKEAMGFIAGTPCLPHALGTPKPWDWNFFKSVLNGIAPSTSVKKYWESSNSPIICYSSFYLKVKMVQLKISSFLGRFYSKN